jgi:DNA-binding SARP family transcriptional activator/ABC-type transport system substrate-binding protein
MEYKILGPVEARDGERILVGGGGKQVALLTLLLLHRNEAVPIDRLLEDLWGARAPRTALKTLQTYVSQLRRALGEGAIVTQPPGYRLFVDEGSLDADRFAALTLLGRGALEHGDSAEAASTLREALELWRGPALGEMAYQPWAQAPIERLEEERLSALELRIEADLAAGAHRQVVSELESLVRERPSREHLLSLLMIALYRSGRQTDALAAYRAGRVRLLDELGVEPTPKLREVEQRILRHDPALGAPPEHAGTAAVARRPRRRAAIAAAVTLLAIAAAILVVVERGSPDFRAAVGPDALASIDRSGRSTAEISVGASPAHAIRAAGFLWTSNERDGTLSKVDFTRRTVETIPVGRDPEGLAFSDGELWVADAHDGRIVAVDPRSGKVVRSIRVGNEPVALASRGPLLWVADGTDGTLTTVDARAGRVLRTVGVGSRPTAVAAGASGLWLALGGSNEVVELDRDGRAVLQAVNVGNEPTALAIAGPGIWVANVLDDTASRIDARSGSIDAVAQLGGTPRSLAVGSGTIWATLAGGSLVQFDALSGRIRAASHVGGEPAAVVVAGSNVWMTTLDGAASHRGGTLRIETAEISECACFDPTDYPSLSSWQLLDLVYDGLVAYRRVEGPAGSTLVADLAQTVPRPDATGRTYVFRLRPRIRFSNGHRLRPSDVRASFERLFQLDVAGVAPFYGAILGAATCAAGHRCDLSRGIVGGDDGDTVTFHLAAPDPDFLYKLALPPAFVVPRGSPLTITHRPLPGTGAYRVEGTAQLTRLVLSRNPRFRVFAPDATPDGFPDRIVAHTDVPPLREVAAVRNQTADVATSLAGLPANVATELATRYASQLHGDLAGETEYLFLNTRVPPFDRLSARRALNDAVARTRLVQLMGGPSAARPTCQLLPPGFPGYRPYCPYGRRPSAAGTVTPPNLAEAARLVAVSGTYGAHVQVWAPADHAAIARYTAGVLRKLGYSASARIVTGDTSRYYGLIGAAKTRAQVGWAGWIRDYTSPADFMPLVTCQGISPTEPTLTTNYSRACSAELERRIHIAQALQQDRPVLADAAWRAVDRLIVDQALTVPFGSDVALTLLSPRTGGYQDNPEFGVLLDQLWVR